MKRIKSKMNELYKVISHEPHSINMIKKWINGKLKEFKFEMLEARVEIVSKIKELESLQKEK